MRQSQRVKQAPSGRCTSRGVVLFVLVLEHSQLEFSINFITHDQTLYKKRYYVELVSTWWSDDKWIWKHIPESYENTLFYCAPDKTRWQWLMAHADFDYCLRGVRRCSVHSISIAELLQREFLFTRKRLSKHGIFSVAASSGLGSDHIVCPW